MAVSKDWDRLAELTRERRVELGLTQEDVRAEGGPSTATMRLIEGALQQGYQPATLRDLEKALRWERGSVIRVLGGGDPAVSDPVPFPGATPEMELSMERHLDEIRVRAELARRRHPGQRLTGQMMFPTSPRDALSWDQMLSAGWPPEAVEKGLAALRAWAEEAARRDRDDGIATGLIAASSHHPRHTSLPGNNTHARGRKALSMLR